MSSINSLTCFAASESVITFHLPSIAVSASRTPPPASRTLAGPPSEPDKARSTTSAEPAAFLCEEDVRLAVRAGRRLFIDERTILTPSARDLGEAERIFVLVPDQL